MTKAALVLLLISSKIKELNNVSLLKKSDLKKTNHEIALFISSIEKKGKKHPESNNMGSIHIYGRQTFVP